MQNLYKTSATSMMIMDKTLISMMSISYKMNTSEVQNCSQMCINSICVCVVALYLIVMSKCLLKRMEKDIYISNREERERERERETLLQNLCVFCMQPFYMFGSRIKCTLQLRIYYYTFYYRIFSLISHIETSFKITFALITFLAFHFD
jgi:hypothetical protein